MADDGGGYPFDLAACGTVVTTGGLSGEKRNLVSSARKAAAPTGSYTVTIAPDHALNVQNMKVLAQCQAPSGTKRFADVVKTSTTTVDVFTYDDTGALADSDFDIFVFRCN